MSHSIVFTFVGADKPGLVEKVSNTVTVYGGNWQESRMNQLAGYFTGIAKVQVSNEQHAGLMTALTDLTGEELTVSIQQQNLSAEAGDFKLQQLSLLGNDRPGIVKELSRALAAFNINVCEMNTAVTSAPMTAEPLFEANASIQVPITLNISQLSDKLEEIANQLSVDITLED
ncbi:glycine cleavage system protein R [Oceanicoccus sp. KOV_DT_Chl]|uniref:glycine cleavage system protein R n=1 Tax=Oceanicoccus sp. KOV_DT_Chl TaxID=1904639 RepID=UPI000C7B944E|nr:ACT domain-containing protein [Oceanicoccus sp. KOV_DT_Chl]